MEYFIDSHFRKHKCVQKEDKDEDVDVAAERKRVLRGSGKKDLLRLENLTKVRCSSFYNTVTCLTTDACFGAQWLSGRVLDLRPMGPGFEPHRPHCVVVLEQDTFILA